MVDLPGAFEELLLQILKERWQRDKKAYPKG
jgi:hypothetical protein